MGRKSLDLKDLTFGYLTVVSKSGNNEHGHVLWRCKCICGKETIKSTSFLRGKCKHSCGCIPKKGNIKHGMAHDLTYSTWCAIVQRCTNPKNPDYKYYGGRGIKMCNSWRDSFESFYKDMGQRPSNKHSIERINNDGNYEPSNCKWATQLEQVHNRRYCKFITWNGKTQTMTQWAKEIGIKPNTLVYRFRSGWSVEDALTRLIASNDTKTSGSTKIKNNLPNGDQ